jgi:O-methyltransferase
MDNIKLKLLFIQRVLTDTVGDKQITDEFFANGIYPTDSKMEEIVSRQVSDDRLYGRDWPHSAHTMIGLKRMNNLHESLDYVRENNIQGDFIETGVWRGGASIFAKKYFDLYGMNRKVFVADSFKGLPPPQVQEDAGDPHHTIDFLRVSLADVQNNFKLYGALDENVIFLEGWFEDTLPNNTSIGELSVLRMDGDMYKSTMDVFDSCYHKVVKGGRVIIDDYCIPNCKNAVHKFREVNSFTEEITVIDQCGIFWTKN